MAAENHRPAKRTKYDFTNDVTVLIGKDEKKFALHKSLICKSSIFFWAAYSGVWKESKEATVRLPETETQSFTTYVGWLYTERVDLLEEPEQKLPWTDKKGETLPHRLPLTRRAIDCFALGDMLQDVNFRNAVITELMCICKMGDTIPSLRSITCMWEVIPQNSKMVELIAEYWAAECSTKEFDASVDMLPDGFVKMLARVGIRDKHMASDMRKPSMREKWRYHEHASENEKCK
ncbi:hypothetical protein LTR37_006915 [Vermiconidia calcicola]|uniref:Uncharacterized protein n=1 Tax=Vermiconidia calcicola TaxID=1690605 RepID=A0ACC3NER8_9PEZI|nr:hypothetical protein LTR37_006915 [Vermiconidia calcicola]